MNLVIDLENCEVPGFPGISILDVEIPGVLSLRNILEALENALSLLIESVISCINECYYDGADILTLDHLLQLAGVDNFDGWLFKPGLGSLLKSALDSYIGPFKELLTFFCSISEAINCFIDPENIADALSGDFDWLLDCFDIEVPWPFPCNWLYFVTGWNFKIDCETFSFPSGVKIEMPNLGLDLTCLLGFEDFGELTNGLINGDFCINLCELDVEGFGSISAEFLIQILGILLSIPAVLLDKLLSYGACIFKNIINEEFSLGIDFDSILGDIINILNSLNVVDIDLDGYASNLEAWVSELEVQLPWLCVIRCFLDNLFTDFLSPLIDFIEALFEFVGDTIGAALNPLGGLEVLLDTLRSLQTIELITGDYCINIKTILSLPEDCLLES